jgi:hypothetical protein
MLRVKSSPFNGLSHIWGAAGSDPFKATVRSRNSCRRIDGLHYSPAVPDRYAVGDTRDSKILMLCDIKWHSEREARPARV